MNTIWKVLVFIQQHRMALVIGVVLGLILGLVIAWVIWPAEWTNATPSRLRSDFQSDYLVWVANQYHDNGDPEWARQKLLGADYQDEKRERAVEEMALSYEEALSAMAQERGGEEQIRLEALAQILPALEEPTTSIWTILRPVAMVCGVLLLLLLFAVGAWFVVNRLRSSRAEREAAERGVGVAVGPSLAEQVSWGAEGAPLAQFPTTYTLGDDHYDPSFSVELESGEFMGECGVGISETIGVGAPNKVTAFEVWLFDKSDIRTVTKVLMSDYAFHDEALRTKLAPKGEPMLAEVGKDVVLETKTLRVRARVVEAVYGVGNLPPNSFFERLTMDLAAWVRPVPAETQPMEEANVPVMPPAL
jgi:hypothetical protein